MVRPFASSPNFPHGNLGFFFPFDSSSPAAGGAIWLDCPTGVDPSASDAAGGAGAVGGADAAVDADVFRPLVPRSSFTILSESLLFRWIFFAYQFLFIVHFGRICHFVRASVYGFSLDARRKPPSFESPRSRETKTPQGRPDVNLSRLTKSPCDRFRQWTRVVIVQA